MGWVFALVGIIASYQVGTQVLGFGPDQIVRCIIAANIGSFISLVVTTRSELRPRFKRIINRRWKTWCFAWTVALSIVALIYPPLRDPRSLFWMAIPLFFTSALMFPLFGVIQDQLVRRAQRRAKVGQSTTGR